MPNKCLVAALAAGFLAFILSTAPATLADRQLPRGAECTWRGGKDITGLICDIQNCRSDETLLEAYNEGRNCQKSHCCKTKSLHTTTGSVNPCDDMVGPGYDYVQPSGQPGKCVPKKKIKSMKKIKCSNPNATYNAQLGRCALPMKKMGKEYTGPKDKTVVRNACISNHWVWDEKTQRCRKPSQAKADCEARGSSYRYDLDTRACVGGMSKGKRKSQAKADCEERGPRFRYDFDTGRCIKRVDMSGENTGQEFDDEDLQPQKKKKKRKIELDIDDIF